MRRAAATILAAGMVLAWAGGALGQQRQAVSLPEGETLRRVKGSIEEIERRRAAGEAIEYDTHPTPVGAFHGVFEVRFLLDPALTDGSLVVDILVRRPEDGDFRKVAEAKGADIPPKPESGEWVGVHYWDARSAAFDWTEEDAAAYATAGPVLVRLRAH